MSTPPPSRKLGISDEIKYAEPQVSLLTTGIQGMDLGHTPSAGRASVPGPPRLCFRTRRHVCRRRRC